MNLKDIIDFIAILENKFSVNEWTVDGVKVWPIIRHDIYNQLVSLSSSYTKKTAKNKIKSKIEQINKMVYTLLCDLRRKCFSYKNCERFQQKTDVLLVTYNVTRNFKTVLGEYYSYILDPIRDKLKYYGINAAMLECFSQYSYRAPVHRSSYYIQTKIDYCILKNKITCIIKGKLGVFEHHTNSFDNYDKLVEYINQTDYRISMPSKNFYVNQMLLIFKISDCFKSFIKRSGAKVGIIVCYYNIIGYAFNLACRNLKIPSFDIQHGLSASSFHGDYAGWTNIPSNGYEFLPRYFWCWDKQTAAVINSWSAGIQNYHKAIVGGNVSMEMWKDNNNLLVKHFDQVFNSFKLKKRCVLVTLQTNVNIMPALLEVILKNSVEWHWVIRLHPTMVNKLDDVKNLFNGFQNVFIDEAKSIPIGMWIRNIDVHITSFSGVVKDCKEFGIYSVCIDKLAENVFENEIEMGIVKLAYTYEEILNAVKVQMAKKTCLRSDASFKNAVEFIVNLTKDK